LALSVSRAEQILDRIIAIVGDQIILQSELDFQQQVFLAQTGQKIEDPARLKQLKSQLLEQMINDRLIQAQAEKDSTLRVTPNEVETALEEHLQRIKSQFATEEEFLQKLAEENLTVRELKLKYREDVRGQILKEGLVNQRLAKVAVSAKEVKDFYNNYRDSLPSQPASVKLSHILLPMKPSQKTLDSLESFAESIRQKALAGEDFAVLAQTFSQDATARTGGDLGFFGKGELDSTFERVAFSLAPGEISGVVWTVYGYHLIKVEERKSDQVRARHILILTTPSAQDQNRAERLADSLYQLLRNGADFSSLAQEFSGDPTSQKLGGDLGWVAVEVLEPVFLKAISNLQPGEISPPAKSEYGLHIFSLQDRQEKRGLTLDDDWDTVKALAKRHKTGEEIQKWVADLRIKIYVEIKPES
jgi:peptidyl-prolyl cis-trans isomerase SurA